MSGSYRAVIICVTHDMIYASIVNWVGTFHNVVIADGEDGGDNEDRKDSADCSSAAGKISGVDDERKANV